MILCAFVPGSTGNMPLDDTPVSLEEVVQLGAVDSEFFCRQFFSNTVRQTGAPFHQDIWRILDGPDRLVNIQVFRGGAKTSLLRMYTAKRIAYGLAHTILYIGKSEGHAARSINWLRRQVEHNRAFAHVFGLRAGQKWQDTEAEIWHGTDEYPVWIMGMGITGSVRGINRDDFRPDLIVCDDILDEENTATDDQREKISDLLYGAVKESLAPPTECPEAKLVLLQTPLHQKDLSTLALSDRGWRSAVFGCWTEGTKSLPVEKRESAWVSRYPAEYLRKERGEALARNKLSKWVRENECKIIAPEESAFKLEWLKYYDMVPETVTTVMVIDPVPPPSEIQVEKGLHKKDFEAFAVVGRSGKDVFLLEYSLRKGHDPSWTIAEFFRLASKWLPLRIYVESVNYQRTLAWILRQGMERQGRWWPIEEYDDRRSKYDKITDGLNDIASSGHFHVRHEHVDFVDAFRDYPKVPHDDLIEAVAIACKELSSPMFNMAAYEKILEAQKDVPKLEYARGCP